MAEGDQRRRNLRLRLEAAVHWLAGEANHSGSDGHGYIGEEPQRSRTASAGGLRVDVSAANWLRCASCRGGRTDACRNFLGNLKHESV